MAELICEGRCNGGEVQRYDAAVTAVGRAHANGNGLMQTTVSLVSEQWLSRARGFEHTTHREMPTRRTYQCVKCGWQRQW